MAGVEPDIITFYQTLSNAIKFALNNINDLRKLNVITCDSV